MASLVFLLAGAAPSLAQSASDDKKAKRLYEEGEDLYEAGKYLKAAEKFKEAHRLSKRPALLFNLANAYERGDEFEKAAAALEDYLDDGSMTSKKRRATRARIKTLERKAADKRAREELLRKLAEQKGNKGDKGNKGNKGNQSDTPLIEEPDDGESKLGTYLLLGGGGAAILSGVVFGIAASSAGSSAEDQCSSSGNGLFCPSSAKSDIDREKTFALLADISYGVGLVALGVGAYLLFAGDEDSAAEEESALSVTPTFIPGGAGVGITGSF